MKKAISMMLATAMAATCLAGCGSAASCVTTSLRFRISRFGEKNLPSCRQFPTM